MWPNFYLFTRYNNVTSFSLTSSNFNNSYFNSSRRTYLIIHGFTDNANESWTLSIKNNILKTQEANIIAVDWRQGSAALQGDITSVFIYPPYITAARNVITVGNKTAQLLAQLNINPMLTHCIGHSLGAHCCGVLGKNTKIDRITGMDPAGPGFYNLTETFAFWRLSRNDANFVDIIHTSLAFGLFDSIGHVDFWPNLGLEQPGCKSDPICSHGRTRDLFAESILSSSYFPTSDVCSSPVLWLAGGCKCKSNCNHMGFYANGNIQGSFYLYTNAQSPFSISRSNVICVNFLYLFLIIFLRI